MEEILEATWLVLFASGVFCQLLAPLFYVSRIANQYAAYLSAMFLLFSLTLAFNAFGNKAGLYVGVATIYLLINALVLLKWQFHPLRTSRQVVNSAMRIVIVLGLVSIIDAAGELTALNIAASGVVVAGFLSLNAMYRVARARPPDTVDKTPKPKTVALAVPARNETHALTKHLKSVLTSDYEKLEVIVADDCSQDDTAQIIRSFAHDGVRFVDGLKPEGSWLGKNSAYQRLVEESSAEIIIFSGVDTRYSEGTIGAIVHQMNTGKLDMVSVMPQHKKLVVYSMLIQPLRYLLTAATASSRRPVTLSTVWAIRRTALDKLGGFAAVQNAISPEVVFARELAKKRRYRFIIAPQTWGLTTFKKPSSQLETAIRTAYPLLRRSVANHLIFTLVLAVLVVAPITSVVIGIASGWSIVATLSLLTLVVVWLAYAFVIAQTYPANRLLLSPLSFLIGCGLVYYASLRSMIDYERDAIIWKGRNVCYPVMRPN